jgi:hypothetical protein
MKPLILLLLLVLAACGVRPTVPIEGGAGPTEELTEGTVLYLLHGATLTRVVRPATAGTALNVLAEGLTREELAEGLTTEVPRSAAPITATMSSGGISVRVSSGLRSLSPLARSQLVCTAIPPDGNGPMTVVLSDAQETLPPQQCPFAA